MELLERVLGALTSHTWISSTQSYRLSGPPGSYSSAEVTITRGRIVNISDRDAEQRGLNAEVEDACRERMPETMNVLVEMDEDTPR
jgi:hypothetical protein